MARQNKRIGNEESMSQALSRASDTAQDLTGGLESIRDSLRDRFATTDMYSYLVKNWRQFVEDGDCDECPTSGSVVEGEKRQERTTHGTTEQPSGPEKGRAIATLRMAN